MICVEYAVATGLDVTPDEASEGLFPGCRVVLVGCDVFGQTRTYHFLVEQPDGPLDVLHET